MRLFLPELKVDPNEGFSLEKDIFQRKEFGDGLTNILREVEDPMVLVLDSPWGSGKTTFVKMWAGELRNVGLPVVYFDAYANDHLGDAFTSIAGEVIDLVKQKELSNTDAYKDYLEKSKSVGKTLLRSGLKVGIKALTFGALDEEDFEDLKGIPKEIADEASAVVDKHVLQKLEGHAQNRVLFDEFRDSLKVLAGTIGDNEREDGDESRKPLIFIIDELDRCKPSYALELLEQIKHYFSTENVHFVLVTHLEQLANSVNHEYGVGLDSKLYLQKFYNYTVSLPKELPNAHIALSNHFLSHVFSSLPDDDEGGRFKGAARNTISKFAEFKGYQLRTLERITTCFALVLAYTTKGNLRIYSLIPQLCILKIANPNLYEEARVGTLTFVEIEEFFEFDKWETNGYDKKWWQYCLLDELPEDEDWSDLGSSLFRYAIHDRKDIIPITINKIMERFTV